MRPRKATPALWALSLSLFLTRGTARADDLCRQEAQPGTTLLRAVTQTYHQVGWLTSLKGTASAVTELTFSRHLRNREAYLKELTGVGLNDLERYQRAAFEELVDGHPLLARYDRDVLRQATFASAIYESLARTPGEDLTDRVQSARGADPSMGPFQAYAAQTARALANPRVRAWTLRHGDAAARAFVQRIQAGPIDSIRISQALEGTRSPLHTSATLSLLGKMQLTLEYIEEVDRKNPVVRRLPQETQLRVWCDAETLSDDELYTSPRLQREALARPPGARIRIAPGHARMHRVLDALGIAYLRGDTLIAPKTTD